MDQQHETDSQIEDVGKMFDGVRRAVDDSDQHIEAPADKVDMANTISVDWAVAEERLEAPWLREAADAVNAVGPAVPQQQQVDRGLGTFIQTQLGILDRSAHESHCSVRFSCFCLAVVLVLSSISVMLGLSDTPQPFEYLMAAYNVFFAGVIVVVDGNHRRNKRLEEWRKRLFEAVPALASPSGRAVFYVYVGSFNLVMPNTSVMRYVFLLIGAALILVGGFVLTDGFRQGGCRCGKRHSSQRGIQEDVMNIGAEVVDGCRQVNQVVRSQPMSVRLACFLAALALFIASVLSCINIFGAFLQPFHFLVAVYNIIFSVVLMLLDAQNEWLPRLSSLKLRVIEQAAFLGTFDGRAIFCIYVGSLNLALMPGSILWKLIYGCIGVVFTLSGVLMLVSKYVWLQKEADIMLGEP